MFGIFPSPVAAGGERLGTAGNFFAPTVLDNVSRDCRVFNEEPFGPVALINRYAGEEAMIAEANDQDLGEVALHGFKRPVRAFRLLGPAAVLVPPRDGTADPEERRELHRAIRDIEQDLGELDEDARERELEAGRVDVFMQPAQRHAAASRFAR